MVPIALAAVVCPPVVVPPVCATGAPPEVARDADGPRAIPDVGDALADVPDPYVPPNPPADVPALSLPVAPPARRADAGRPDHAGERRARERGRAVPEHARGDAE